MRGDRYLETDAKVCVRVQGDGGRRTSSTVTTWGAMTNQILALREHLAAQQVTVVVMEATSDYWRPFYYLLEADFQVMLVNAPACGTSPAARRMCPMRLGWRTWARTVWCGPRSCRRNRSGQLRDLTRARTVVTRERTREIQRLEKFLEDAGIKLSSVATEITGVSGRLMLQALIDSQGTADPEVLAGMAKGKMRSKIPALAEALNGRFTAHHAFMARLYLDRVDAHTRDIEPLSERIEELMEPFLPAREVLDSIPGFSQIVAEVFIAETGGDMRQFPTPGQLASWAGVSPGSNESAGRVKSTKTRPGNNYLKGALGSPR